MKMENYSWISLKHMKVNKKFWFNFFLILIFYNEIQCTYEIKKKLKCSDKL
jgi:hypothetical protein